MQNKKYVIIPVAMFLLLLAAAGTASAYGGGNGAGGKMKIGGDPSVWTQNFEEKMKEQASVLGISIADLKASWAQGKNIHDIAKEKGVSDTDLRAKMQAQKTEQMKQYLKTLVDNGSITQAQADARLKFSQDKKTNKKQGEGCGCGGKMMGK